MTSATQAQRKNIRITVISIVGVMILFFGMFLNKMLTPRVLSADELRHNGIVLFEQPRLIKDFSLVNKNGTDVDKSVFQNKITFVFFGFTHCPDVCPTTLAELGKVYNELNLDAQKDVQVALVTLDPARDTPEKLNTYVNYFGEEIIGLTGDFPKIMSLTKNVNIAFKKVPQGDDYTIDHSSQVILLNRKGDYAGFIKTPLPVAALPRIIESTLVQVLD